MLSIMNSFEKLNSCIFFKNISLNDKYYLAVCMEALVNEGHNPKSILNEYFTENN